MKIYSHDWMKLWYSDSLDSFGYDEFFETSTAKYSSTSADNDETDSGIFQIIINNRNI